MVEVDEMSVTIIPREVKSGAHPTRNIDFLGYQMTCDDKLTKINFYPVSELVDDDIDTFGGLDC